MTFRLQRHSDHHAHGRSLWSLRVCEREVETKGERKLTFFFSFFLQIFSCQLRTAEKSFETLRDEPDAPQLPASYPVMMVTAVAFPALFRRVMEPRAREEQAKNEERRRKSKGGDSGGIVVR